MAQIEFSAIGTEWAVLLDHALTMEEEQELSRELQKICTRFDQKYSRFLPDSWIHTLRSAEAEERSTHLDEEALQLFTLGWECELFTEGHFSLNIAGELEQTGYDAEYSLIPKTDKLPPKGQYWLEGNTLHTKGRVAFDLGAFGKGFLIDTLAHTLFERGYEFFLVDGSGDFFGTHKSTGAAWNIALEHPTADGQAIGTFSLLNQGFASSAPSRRRWGEQHHILDARTGKPVEQREAVFVSAPTAVLSDAFATALFVSPESLWNSLQKIGTHEWCVLEKSDSELAFRHSPGFPAQLFTQ